jgi:uncharacterized protein YjlB
MDVVGVGADGGDIALPQAIHLARPHGGAGEHLGRDLLPAQHADQAPDRVVVHRGALARAPDEGDDAEAFQRVAMQQVLPIARAGLGEGIGQPGFIRHQAAQQGAALGEPARLAGAFVGQAGHVADEIPQRSNVRHRGAPPHLLAGWEQDSTTDGRRGMHEHRGDGAEMLMLRADPAIPNNPRLPVVLHRGAVAAGDADGAEALLGAHGWRPAWRNGIHDWQHYHSNAHEALVVVSGQVRVQLGGETGLPVALRAGDVVVLPAGTGHRNLGASADLLVVGAYPEGSAPPDQLRGAPEERARAMHAIAATADPPSDPVTGGPYPRG